MAFTDVESYAERVLQPPYHSRRPSSPVSSTSLNQEHIADALNKSEDKGATLDFSHKGLTDVGEYGAEELAAIGREDHVEDESSVTRYACPEFGAAIQLYRPYFILGFMVCVLECLYRLRIIFVQDLTGQQPTSDAAHGIRTIVSLALFEPEEEQLYRVP